MRKVLLVAVMLASITTSHAETTKYPGFSVVGAKITPSTAGAGNLLVLVLNVTKDAADIEVACTLKNGDAAVGAATLHLLNVPPQGQVAESKIVFEPAETAECRVSNIR